MPPVDSIAKIRNLVSSKLVPAVPTKWMRQFTFGMRAYAFAPFRSAASNARGVVANPHTAGTKSDRLLANGKLAVVFGKIFDTLQLITPNSFLNVDHSDCNGLMVLAAALQTYDGRALPCMIETTYSDRLPASKDAPKRKQRLRAARAEERKKLKLTEHTVNALKGLISRLGFCPKFVFDRGFCNEAIVKALHKAGATFYIRAKAGRVIEYAGERTVLSALPDRDTIITLYGLKLRVVRSVANGVYDEPWYVLTNDLTTTPEEIVRIYYHRFEIEETFKDVKHILGLKRTRLNNPNSLKIILWLVSLGLALMYLAEDTAARVRRQAAHPKKRLSYVLMMTEQLMRGYSTVLWDVPQSWLATEAGL